MGFISIGGGQYFCLGVGGLSPPPPAHVWLVPANLRRRSDVVDGNSYLQYRANIDWQSECNIHQ